MIPCPFAVVSIGTLISSPSLLNSLYVQENRYVRNRRSQLSFLTKLEPRTFLSVLLQSRGHLCQNAGNWSPDLVNLRSGDGSTGQVSQ
jgi:hypothetical protein